jgi:murein L,D-transpeptidase YafK
LHLNRKQLKRVIKIALLVLFTGTALSQSFKDQQLRSQRVKKAYETKWAGLEKEIKDKGLDPKNFDLFVRAFKTEGELEIWLKNLSDKSYKLLKTIPICAASGGVGPKRKEGDGQVPEGIYQVESFNPASSYYLALKVSYPNASDRILAKGPTGGDIMIHGNCVTIGCIPLTDEPIKELYVLAVEAKNRKLPIRIEIYPCRFTEVNLTALEKVDAAKMAFWNNIKGAYSFFENHKRPVKYSIDKKGTYVYAE